MIEGIQVVAASDDGSTLGTDTVYIGSFTGRAEDIIKTISQRKGIEPEEVIRALLAISLSMADLTDQRVNPKQREDSFVT